MSFDPTKPANNSPVSSSELRSQLTGLKTLIDACPTTTAMGNYVFAQSAGPCNGVDELTIGISSPPTDGEVEAIVTKLNELIVALKRI